MVLYNMLTIQPENLEIANLYLQHGSIDVVADKTDLPRAKVEEILEKTEVKRYIDNIYLDTGYRNRFKLADTLDEIIENKIAETGLHSEKDLVDLLKFALQIRAHEQKQAEPSKQTNVQINEFGPGSNYSDLIKRLTG